MTDYPKLIHDLRDRASWLEFAIHHGESENEDAELMKQAADALDKLHQQYRTCRNELCLYCGNYKMRHLGACNDCRWKAG